MKTDSSELKPSRGRRRRTALVVAAAPLALGTAAQWELGRRLEGRFREALADDESHRGELERVSVCLLCLSYTIHDLQLEGRDQAAPILSAPAIVVGVNLAALFRARCRGRIGIRDATLHVGLGRDDHDAPNAFSISWRTLGRGLFPAAISRIDASGGEVVVRYEHFEEPIEWRFSIHDGFATQLASDGVSPSIRLGVSTPGEGRFELALDVDPSDPDHSRLRGELHDVALVALDSYLRQRLGLEVEGGSLSAKLELEGTRTSWAGHMDCQIEGLDVFDLDDLVEHGPIQATRDGIAAVATTLQRSRDGKLQMRLEIDENLGADTADPWLASARILRWMVLAPFTAPLRFLPGTESP